MCVFRNLNEVRDIKETWTRQYKEAHSYDSLDDLTPLKYLAIQATAENSNWMCN